MTDRDPAAPAAARRSLKERLADHMREYGQIAVVTYLVISLLAIAGFSIAIGAGISPSSATGVLGVIGAGWAAAKITIPIRILITLAVTPVVAAIVRRRRPVTAVDAGELAVPEGAADARSEP